MTETVKPVQDKGISMTEQQVSSPTEGEKIVRAALLSSPMCHKMAL